jgi:hypothetical protein
MTDGTTGPATPNDAVMLLAVELMATTAKSPVGKLA